MRHKLLSKTAVDLWVQEQRALNRRIGFTCGAFDLLHAGHVDFLERARQCCDRLLVAVNSDRSIRLYKSPLRPINPESERMQVVAGLECVDAVVLMEEQRPLSAIERWHPELYIKGGDYSAGGLRSGAAVEAYGGKVVLLPFAIDQSTTAILNRIEAIHAHRSLAAGPQIPNSSRLVFLDRDGTLIRNVPYLHDPAKVELLPGVAEGLVRLQAEGFRLVIVTNQQGIGLGYFAIEDFFAVNLALFRALTPYGIKIDKVYFCPHSLADECKCRKPGTALIEKALHEYDAIPGDCWMLGDSESDIEAGEAAGCRAIRIVPGFEPGHNAVASFAEAVDLILRRKPG
jgi:D-glycero-D-manno-heptose 1,7-bisphosphate phosphatase